MSLVETGVADDAGVSEGTTGESRIDMRRRRSGGTWFPTIGSEIIEATHNAEGREFVATFGVGTAEPLTLITALTFDEPTPAAENTADKTLADIVGSEYVLKRIVGKLFIQRIVGQDANGNDVNPALLISAGFFVARTADSSGVLGQELPIGADSAADGIGSFTDYNPLSLTTVQEP